MPKDGIAQKNTSGSRLLDSSGRKILTSSDRTLCCCVAGSCPSTPTQRDCISAGSTALSSTICCCDINLTPTITFPTLTPAAGIATKPYGQTVQAAIDAISGAMVELVNYPTNNNQCRYFTHGVVTQVGAGSGKCCTVYTWWLELVITGTTLGYQLYAASLYVMASTIEGPGVAVGDALTCPRGGSSFIQVAGMSSTAQGDCCGKDAGGSPLVLSFDAVDSDYFAAEFDTDLGSFSPACAYCNRAEMASCVTMDAGAFHAYLSGIEIDVPALTYNGIVGGVNPGTSDMYKRDGDADWVYIDATKRYKFGFVRIQNNNGCGVYGNPDGTDTCCWSLQVESFEVQEDTGGGWTTVAAMGTTARFVIVGAYHSALAGTYDLANGPVVGAPSTVTVTEGC